MSEKSKAISLELRAHLDKCFTAISTSTPHLYVSSLPWIVKDSHLYTCWHDEFSSAWALKRPLRSASPLLRTIRCPRAIEIVAVSPDGLSILAGTGVGLNAMLCLWDIQSGCLKKEARTRDIVKGGTQKDEGDGSQATYDDQGRWLIDTFPYLVLALAYSADNKQFFFAVDSQIHICDADTLKRIMQPLEAHRGWVSCIAVARHGEIFASAGDKSIKVWSTISFQTLYVLEEHAGSVTSIMFSPDGSRLASGSSYRVDNEWEGELGIWPT